MTVESDIMAFYSDGKGHIAPLLGGFSTATASAEASASSLFSGASGILAQLFVPIVIILTLVFIFSYIHDDVDAMALEFAILIAVIIMIKVGY